MSRYCRHHTPQSGDTRKQVAAVGSEAAGRHETCSSTWERSDDTRDASVGARASRLTSCPNRPSTTGVISHSIMAGLQRGCVDLKVAIAA